RLTLRLLRALGLLLAWLRLLAIWLSAEQLKGAVHVHHNLCGVDALAANSQTYYAAFFSEAEKVEDTIDSIKRTFETADVELAASREAYRAMVEDIDLTTEAGQQMFATMMELSGQAAQYYSIIEQQAAEAAAQALANTHLYYD
ncbi:hypothetical protein ABR330_22595, partial [Bacillus cabrialesii subsp. cabrialesii]|uniref:hypothetical protein n=1 Tax=Bacillus cabrialesii TaxID=2487276 RepID=UPI0033063B1F